MTDYTDGSTVRGIRLKTGRIVYELRDKQGKTLFREEFNKVREEAKRRRVYPKYLIEIEKE